MIDEKAIILSNEQIMLDTYLLRVRAPQSAHQAQPGQFAMVKIPSGNGIVLRRPLSIHRAEEDSLFYIYSIVGKGTGLLSKQKEGMDLNILAPLGKGFQLPEDKAEVLLLAGGIGIAPIAFLAEKALERGIKLTLLLGARSEQCLYPRNYLPRGINIALATEDGSLGFKGLLTDLFPSYLQGKSHVYACGPLDMYRSVSALMSPRTGPSIEEMPEMQVSLEARMGCGVGACYGCVINTRTGLKRVCKDGPVFNFEEILWEEVRI